MKGTYYYERDADALSHCYTTVSVIGLLTSGSDNKADQALHGLRRNDGHFRANVRVPSSSEHCTVLPSIREFSSPTASTMQGVNTREIVAEFVNDVIDTVEQAPRRILS